MKTQVLPVNDASVALAAELLQKGELVALPTGTVVECQDQRSQRENKERALKVLRSRLLQQKQDAYDEAYNAQRQSQVGSGDRSEKIRTYNFPQDRVTDHRIGLTLRNLQGVLDGDLDRVIEPLILADREEKLKQNHEDTP